MSCPHTARSRDSQGNESATGRTARSSAGSLTVARHRAPVTACGSADGWPGETALPSQAEGMRRTAEFVRRTEGVRSDGVVRDGPTSPALIGQTIGDNLEATVARFPGNEALVVPHQDVRLTYRQFDDRVDQLARALIGRGLAAGDRLGIWAPNCAEWALVQYATAKIGVILVNINPAYRTHEVEYALRQSGCRGPGRGHRLQDQRLRGDGRRGPTRRCPTSSTRALPRHARLGRPAHAGADGRRSTSSRARERDAVVRRPDQHPVHERHHRLPEGRHAHPPQHPQQRLLRRRGLPVHRARPGVHPGARSTTASAW